MTRTPILCRLGFHRYMPIPLDVSARILKAGVRQLDWYAGRHGPDRCMRCGRTR